MNKTQLMLSLDMWDRSGRRVFTTKDLRKIFPEDTEKTLNTQLSRFCAEEKPVITRVMRGLYVNAISRAPRTNLLEEVAKAMRRGHHTYISLESALSEHGAISQIPVGHLTLMTTGRGGEYKTSCGTIEFSHTERSPTDFLPDLLDVGRPLRIANLQRAFTDLKRVGRNIHMVRIEEDFDNARLQ